MTEMQRLTKFIWGLTLLLIGVYGLGQNIHLIMYGEFPLWRSFIVAANLVCITIGGINVYKTT